MLQLHPDWLRFASFAISAFKLRFKHRVHREHRVRPQRPLGLRCLKMPEPIRPTWLVSLPNGKSELGLRDLCDLCVKNDRALRTRRPRRCERSDKSSNRWSHRSGHRCYQLFLILQFLLPAEKRFSSDERLTATDHDEAQRREAEDHRIRRWLRDRAAGDGERQRTRVAVKREVTEVGSRRRA